LNRHLEEVVERNKEKLKWKTITKK
jgi:hypothetical protein